MLKINTVLSNKKWNVKNKVLIMAKTFDLRTEVHNFVPQDYKF
jgi:hypothetical protein